MKEILNQLPNWILEYKHLIAFSTAVLVSSLLIPPIIKYSIKFGYVDIPDNRKIHLNSVPNLGGIAIFSGLFIASLFWFRFFNNPDFLFISIGTIILLITGIIDDIKGMKARKKLLFQIMAAFIVVAGGIRITSFHNFLGINELPIIIQYLFSIIVIVGVINAYNLIDGLDGLAGGIGIVNFGVMGYVFFTLQYTSFALLSFAIAGSILGFLIYNFNPARIFMGDTGALILGFLIVVLGIKAIELNVNTHLQIYSSQNMIFSISSIMFLPVFDTLRVFIIRIFCNKSPFTAGKDHLHHILLKKGLHPREVTYILVTINILIILIGFMINYFVPLNIFTSTLSLIL
jgi:UDP-N-acetylmuramyl pentapeptide phosphotransferase/UDP-N-acetylglucosamine-1-phosphate transferase